MLMPMVRFWITLSGEGRLPVLHFGMTGMVQVSQSTESVRAATDLVTAKRARTDVVPTATSRTIGQLAASGRSMSRAVR